MSDKKFTVHVAREAGHEQELMTRQDIVDAVSTNENNWVFVDSQMVSVEELVTIELNDSTEIRINPGMVGGAPVSAQGGGGHHPAHVQQLQASQQAE